MPIYLTLTRRERRSKMLDFFESIAFGFRAILKWNIIKTALVSGLLVSVV